MHLPSFRSAWGRTIRDRYVVRQFASSLVRSAWARLRISWPMMMTSYIPVQEGEAGGWGRTVENLLV
jgi:hypothetical protein